MNEYINTWTIIVLGITGNLSRKKLIPALYSLMNKEKYKGCIIGTGLEDITKDQILEQAKISDEYFKSIFYYQKLNFDMQEDFNLLAIFIKKIEENFNISGNRLIYLATPPDYFCSITNSLVRSGIVTHNNPNHRIVYEKPFGHNLVSAEELNICIKQTLSEYQIYRVDHYLAKEFTNNILLLRYANMLFKKIWDHESIESIEILFYENSGIEGRGTFYDKYGVLKDVVQNHVLQLLALTAMEPPTSLNAEDIRNKKANLLKSVRVVGGFLGQFEGYLDEPGVLKNSLTETYASLKLFIDHPRWKDVPFYLKAGKELAYKTTQINVILKPVSSCLWNAGKNCTSNIIIMHIMPETGFELKINSKKLGTLDEITSVDLLYKNILSSNSPTAYETLLSEVLQGRQSLVIRFDEVEYQWKIIDQIYALNLPLLKYKKGSLGPENK